MGIITAIFATLMGPLSEFYFFQSILKRIFLEDKGDEEG
jgi:hypothetical protein